MRRRLLAPLPFLLLLISFCSSSPPCAALLLSEPWGPPTSLAGLLSAFSIPPLSAEARLFSGAGTPAVVSWRLLLPADFASSSHALVHAVDGARLRAAVASAAPSRGLAAESERDQEIRRYLKQHRENGARRRASAPETPAFSSLPAFLRAPGPALAASEPRATAASRASGGRARAPSALEQHSSASRRAGAPRSGFGWALSAEVPYLRAQQQGRDQGLRRHSRETLQLRAALRIADLPIRETDDVTQAPKDSGPESETRNPPGAESRAAPETRDEESVSEHEQDDAFQMGAADETRLGIDARAATTAVWTLSRSDMLPKEMPAANSDGDGVPSLLSALLSADASTDSCSPAPLPSSSISSSACHSASSSASSSASEGRLSSSLLEPAPLHSASSASMSADASRPSPSPMSPSSTASLRQLGDSRFGAPAAALRSWLRERVPTFLTWLRLGASAGLFASLFYPRLVVPSSFLCSRENASLHALGGSSWTGAAQPADAEARVATPLNVLTSLFSSSRPLGSAASSPALSALAVSAAAALADHAPRALGTGAPGPSPGAATASRSPPPSPLFAALLFAGASLTDLLDGCLARRWQVCSPLGAFLDALADKLLVTAALGGVCSLAVPPFAGLLGPPAVAICMRELAVQGLRLHLERMQRGVDGDVQWLGKAKTAAQMGALSLLLLFLPLYSGDASRFGAACPSTLRAATPERRHGPAGDASGATAGESPSPPLPQRLEDFFCRLGRAPTTPRRGPASVSPRLLTGPLRVAGKAAASLAAAGGLLRRCCRHALGILGAHALPATGDRSQAAAARLRSLVGRALGALQAGSAWTARRLAAAGSASFETVRQNLACTFSDDGRPTLLTHAVVGLWVAAGLAVASGCAYAQRGFSGSGGESRKGGETQRGESPARADGGAGGGDGATRNVSRDEAFSL
ncbi:hypothetical protein BESB_012360 [Besnoitia besnoiti]|uniref:CDP-alcohol phosphatidyltransferase superfamily protein n=1 Tax=Besnoitia besnoiti TaxID=94643 RepID=A0A2A9M604_BESBE|nr:hypothetical protein BESB_012360 [Besnoitia besnoiti]PFH32624.1 hypothetical protein BESB_012360 [Besnoitia besnoiti]